MITSEYEAVASLDELPQGTLMGVVTSTGEQVCLFNYQGEVGAVTNVCTHAEFPLSDGRLHNDGTIECAWHGARFDCRSGAVCRGPAFDPLPRFDVRVENGVIFVARTAGRRQS